MVHPIWRIVGTGECDSLPCGRILAAGQRWLGTDFLSEAPVRWDDLFADLEAQAEALATAERDAEVDELVRLETSRLCLLDRLRPAVGGAIKLRCLGGLVLSGTLSRVGADWLLLDEGAGREAIVATAALTSVTGQGRLSGMANSRLDAKLGIGHALRGVARDRSVLRACLTDASVIDGTVDRVGLDFVEIAEHAAGEPRRRAEVRQVLLVPISSLAVLRRDS